MNFDLREVVVCLMTMLVVALASLVAVGAVATYSVYVHATSAQRAAAFSPARPIVMAVAMDPCLDMALARPATPDAETGLQCPISRNDAGQG